MKIEITNRKLWLDKVLTANENINAYRITEDQRIEALPWYRRILVDSHDYPCKAGQWSKYDIDTIERALLTEGTGSVYVDDEELSSLEAWL